MQFRGKVWSKEVLKEIQSMVICLTYVVRTDTYIISGKRNERIGHNKNIVDIGKINSNCNIITHYHKMLHSCVSHLYTN